jgi:cyanate permease
MTLHNTDLTSCLERTSDPYSGFTAPSTCVHPTQSAFRTPGAAAAGGIAFINSVGAFGGFVGPYMVGFLKDATGSFDAGMLGMAAILVIATGVAGALTLVIHRS